MNMIPAELKKIEKKDWHLWILLSSLFVILTGFIVLVVFYSDVSRFFQEKLIPTVSIFCFWAILAFRFFLYLT